jgi:glucose/mannose-6-phosphate isomerase
MKQSDPMRGWVESFPDMLERAWDAGIPSPGFSLEPGRFLLIGGMGGSGMAGALGALCLEWKGIVAAAWRDPRLPGWLDSRDRFILSTYSGETREAIAMFREAVARDLPIRVVTSGGPVLASCREMGVPHFEVPQGLAPRASLPWLLAGVLRAAACVEDAEILSAIASLRAEIAGSVPERDPARIARVLDGRLVCLLPFGSAMEIVALRWRNQILENAKQGALLSPLPEMAHNELMGWSWLREAAVPVSFVILVEEWPLPSPWGDLLAALRDVAAERGFPIHLIPPASGKGLDRLLAQILLGDRISVELAELRGVAATPVEAIQRIRGAYGKEQRP